MSHPEPAPGVPSGASAPAVPTSVAVSEGIAVLHADPWMLAVHKPAGLLSQPGLGPLGADCLLGRLQRRWPQAQLVHRLDQATAGLLLVALDPQTHRDLSRAFAERRVQKAYLARVRDCPLARSGRIELPLARIATRPPRYGVVPEAEGGKPALTHWRRLEEAKGNTQAKLGPKSCLLLLKPHTGRSHQLRVHLAQLGHPIQGDTLYGEPGDGRLLLHATGLRLRHPATDQPLRLRCPPPWR